MKKISEMSLEELQDYALELQENQAASEQREQDLTNKVNTLTDLNQNLQRRNNDLLMRIEQPGTPAPAPAEPPKVVSCEDYARTIADKI